MKHFRKYNEIFLLYDKPNEIILVNFVRLIIF